MCESLSDGVFERRYAGGFTRLFKAKWLKKHLHFVSKKLIGSEALRNACLFGYWCYTRDTAGPASRLRGLKLGKAAHNRFIDSKSAIKALRCVQCPVSVAIVCHDHIRICFYRTSILYHSSVSI